MTPIAKMFLEMTARGVDPEMIALAIETAESIVRPVESPVDAVAEKRRAYDRERHRLKRESGGNSTGHPPDTDSALSFLENNTKNSKKEKKEERAKRPRGEKLPPDAKPTAEHYKFGIENSFDRKWVDRMFEDMRLWARANEHRAVARKSDWDLTFMGWLRRSAGNDKPRPTGPPRGPQGFESLLQQPEILPDELTARSEYDLDIAPN